MMMDTQVADVAAWQIIHEELLCLALARAANEHALCGALLRAHRDGGWRKLGFASFLEYAEQFAGTTHRQTMDRLRVAVTLERLPGLDAALATGRLPFTAVRELTRVVTPDTEELWLDRAHDLTVGEIQRLVSGRERGDLPDDPARAQRHRISFEVSADVYALFRDAQVKVRADSGGSLDDEEVLRLMATTVLDGPTDDGRSAYQIAMTVCQACGSSTQDGAGQEIVVDETVIETAFCDAQHIDGNGHARQDIPPATRRLVLRRQHGRCAIPSCRFTRFLHVHHLQLRSEDGTHDESNLAGLCSSHHAAVHRGALWISGTWRDGLTFTHADGSVYGAVESPGAAAILADVHQALVSLGFKDREARAKVAAVRTHVGSIGSVESALHAALQFRS